MTLSTDALTFGFAYVNGSKRSVAFGGDGTKMKITPRARDALTELIDAGYVEATPPTESIPNREYYRGVDKIPSLGAVAKSDRYDPFGQDNNWNVFVEGEV